MLMEKHKCTVNIIILKSTMKLRHSDFRQSI